MLNGPPAEARPQQCCRAMQLQAECDRSSQQLVLAKRQLSIINPARQQPRAFRDEYERVMKEILALKAAAEGSQEVCHLVGQTYVPSLLQSSARHIQVPASLQCA